MSGYVSRSTINAFVGAALRELGFTKAGGKYKRLVGRWWLVVRIDIDLERRVIKKLDAEAL